MINPQSKKWWTTCRLFYQVDESFSTSGH